MTCAAPVTHRLAMPIMALAPRHTAGRRRRKAESEVGDISHRSVAGRHGAQVDRRLGVYVDAMRYPRGTEDQRASMWLEHTRRHGWKAVAAVEVPDRPDAATATAAELSAAPIVGVAYGYCGAPDQWWQQQVVAGLQRVGADRSRIAELMTSYFELTELHIHPRAQGRGLGEALTRRLLAGRGESHVLLSTPEINGESNRAWRLYRRLGFTDSSAATTSRATPARSRFSAGHCRSEAPGLAR